MTDIDFVILWVDGADKNWQQEKDRYKASELAQADEHIEESAGARRFRDFDTLKYLLRSIEKNAPWYNKIFLVTANQRPDWLKTHPKLIEISHKDFFRDKTHLPTYNSKAIQMNLHYIKDLQEKFVLMDDDLLITRPVKKEHFFRGEKPVNPAVVGLFRSESFYQTNCRNVLKHVRDKYPASSAIFKGIVKNFLTNGDFRMLVFNLLACFTKAKGRFIGGYDHVPFVYLKSFNAEIEKTYRKLFEESSKSRFRKITNVSPWFIKQVYWAAGNSP